MFAWMLNIYNRISERQALWACAILIVILFAQGTWPWWGKP